jgi:HD-GYP domain-containing protein (c-di-GMP phosphodiesterase class II)
MNDTVELPPTATLEGAWDVLEQFGNALQDCDQARGQIRLALEAVRDGLGADAVVWHPGASSEAYEQVGSVELPAHWARDFVNQAARGDRVVRQFLDPGAKPMSPWPTSAALARVSRSRDSWIAALSFHPRRLFQPADLKVLLLARRMLLNHRHQAHAYEAMRDSLFGLVRCLTAAIDAKNPYTRGHSERVARVAARLGQEMGLPSAILSDLYLAGLLHDIGKIGVRDDVLQKAGPLTDEEYEHVKQHALIGDRLAANLKPLQHLRAGVRHHHERWDGGGYPDGLRGEAIPIQARLLAVADSCDAMMAARPYRPALTPARIDSVLAEGAGAQWDPDLVAIFLTCRHELYAICQHGAGEDVVAPVSR